MCNVFNNYFADVGSEIAQHFSSDSTTNFMSFMRGDYTWSLFLFIVKPEEVLDAIKSLKNKKLQFSYSFSCSGTKKFT